MSFLLNKTQKEENLTWKLLNLKEMDLLEVITWKIFL